MKKKTFKIIVCGSLLINTITGCDSEQKIERTQEEDHEMFSVRKSKTDSSLIPVVNPDSVKSPIPGSDSAYHPK